VASARGGGDRELESEVNRGLWARLHERLPAMAFSVYAIAPPEEGSEPHDRWVIHHFGDGARYVVHPGGVLGIEVEGTNFWLLSPDRWQWVRSDNHPPGRVVG